MKKQYFLPLAPSKNKSRSFGAAKLTGRMKNKIKKTHVRQKYCIRIDDHANETSGTFFKKPSLDEEKDIAKLLNQNEDMDKESISKWECRSHPTFKEGCFWVVLRRVPVFGRYAAFRHKE